jgi:hypothetical protein
MPEHIQKNLLIILLLVKPAYGLEQKFRLAHPDISGTKISKLKVNQKIRSTSTFATRTTLYEELRRGVIMWILQSRSRDGPDNRRLLALVPGAIAVVGGAARLVPAALILCGEAEAHLRLRLDCGCVLHELFHRNIIRLRNVLENLGEPLVYTALHLLLDHLSDTRLHTI